MWNLSGMIEEEDEVAWLCWNKKEAPSLTGGTHRRTNTQTLVIHHETSLTSARNNNNNKWHPPFYPIVNRLP